VRSPNRRCGHRTALCGHRTAGAVTELPCAVTELPCAVTELPCAVTELPCAVTEPRVRSPNSPVRHRRVDMEVIEHGSFTPLVFLLQVEWDPQL